MLYILLANGFEEIEALATVDIIRRANIDIKLVGVGSDYITGSHNITVKTDINIEDVALDDDVEGVILPGGIPGTPNLEANDKAMNLLEFAYKNGKLVASICAAPSIFGHKGMLKGVSATCYPGFEKELDGAKVSSEYCVTDKNIITAKGAGASFEFGFAIVDYILNENNTSKKLGEAMQCLR